MYLLSEYSIKYKTPTFGLGKAEAIVGTESLQRFEYTILSYRCYFV